ncbi:hypothetical protein YC2023_061093 [Brassica napus]
MEANKSNNIIIIREMGKALTDSQEIERSSQHIKASQQNKIDKNKIEKTVSGSKSIQFLKRGLYPEIIS